MNDDDLFGVTLNSLPDDVRMSPLRVPSSGMEGSRMLQRTFRTPIMPWQANENLAPLPPVDPNWQFPDPSMLAHSSEWAPAPGGPPAQTPAALQDMLNTHLQRMDQLTTSLARASSPEAADVYRRGIANTSQDIQNMRARLLAAGLKLMPPALATHPGSGGLINQEEMLQQQREGLTPPRD